MNAVGNGDAGRLPQRGIEKRAFLIVRISLRFQIEKIGIYVKVGDTMRVRFLLLRVFVTGLVLSSASTAFSSPNWLNKGQPAAKKAVRVPFDPGERIRYKISYKGLPVGESVLTFYGERALNGRKVYYFVFTSSLPTVQDEEKLYADPRTMLPVRIDRVVKRLGNFPLRIQETYDQDTHRVRIKRKGNFGTKEFTIQRNAPVQNAILLSYYYRSMDPLDAPYEGVVTLPTLELKVLGKGKEYIKTLLGDFPAQVFASIPPKFKLWLSADERRIPLRIEDPNAFGYSLEIKKIEYLGKEELEGNR